MTIVLNGSSGITNDGGYTGDGVVFADTTPANTLVTTTGGNVGVGTATPTDIAGYNSVTVASTTGGWVEVTNGTVRGVLQNGSGDVTLETRSAHPLIFGINGAERARVDSSGNLLVGQTTAGVVNGIGTSIEASGFENARITVNHSSGGSSNGSFYMRFAYGGTVAGTISQSSITSVAYNTSSDYRLKENIVPMANALAKVAQLKPVTYTWKTDGSAGQGFIAHELAEVIPDCVTGEKDATETQQYEIAPAIPATFDEEGNELTPAVEAVMGEREVPVYQGIDTSFLVATLTAAIQEQQAMFQEQQAVIQEQQAIITALTARVEALEGTQP